MPPNNVQFDADQQQFKSPSQGKVGGGGLVGFLVRKGIVKDKAGANKILIAVLVVVIVLIILINR